MIRKMNGRRISRLFSAFCSIILIGNASLFCENYLAPASVVQTNVSVIQQKPTNITGELKRIREMFAVTPEQIGLMVADFHKQMDRGLKGEPSTLMMLPSYVDVPSGDVEGYFLSIDIGGTNFRIGVSHLQKGKEPELLENLTETYTLSEDTSRGEKLFTAIVKFFVDYFSEHAADLEELGFDFSKPVFFGDCYGYSIMNTAINHAIQLSWGKEMQEDDFIGQDIGDITNKYIHRKLPNLTQNAIINDTIAAYLLARHKFPNCIAAFIYGTGTNGCVSINRSEIPEWRLKSPYTRERMMLNMESGDYGSKFLPVNEYDLLVFNKTNKPDKAHLEKMVSGGYVGKAPTEVLKDWVARGLIFQGVEQPDIDDFEFTGEMMSEIEDMEAKDLVSFLEEKGFKNVRKLDALAIRKLVRLVFTRSQKLFTGKVAAAATWKRDISKEAVTIGIEGSMMENKHALKRINNTLFEVFGRNSENIKIEYLPRATLIGAAIASAENPLAQEVVGDQKTVRASRESH